mmetsp:Transcript_1954/g.3162  ORF Transcript_1954/g.3162 Transcript_1954/m.3162 type:complete len:435 (-) Transcript_1954:54-1358(-)
MVVLVESHLHVQAVELAQMAVGVRVFSTENGSDFKYTLKASASSSNLLVELGALRQTCWVSKVVGEENFRPALTLSSEELGRLDLNKAAVVEKFAKKVAYSTGNAHNSGLVGASQREVAVLELQVLAHSERGLFFLTLSLELFVRLCGGLELGSGVVTVSDLEGNTLGCAVHYEELLGLNFYKTLCGLGGLGDLNEVTFDVYHALSAQRCAPLEHLGVRDHNLHGSKRLAYDDKSGACLHAAVVHVATDQHRFTCLLYVELAHASPRAALPVLIAALCKRQVTVSIGQDARLGVRVAELLRLGGFLTLAALLLLLALALSLRRTSAFLFLLLLIVLLLLEFGRQRGLQRQQLCHRSLHLLLGRCAVPAFLGTGLQVLHHAALCGDLGLDLRHFGRHRRCSIPHRYQIRRDTRLQPSVCPSPTPNALQHALSDAP